MQRFALLSTTNVQNLLLSIGWLEDLTKWFKDAFKAIFNAFKELMNDLIIALLKTVLDAVDAMIVLIPVPDFMTNYGMCALLAQAGPAVGWIYNELRFSECMALIVAAYGFRMTRKLLTLFQW